MHSQAETGARGSVREGHTVTVRTELFWHCTLELLKRRAVTRWLTPWMWRTHSYPRWPDWGWGRFRAFRVMGFTSPAGIRISSDRTS